MAKKYVPDGVFLACDKGTCPSTYKVRFDNQTNVYSVPLASELDIIPFLNIKPMGFCMVKGMCTPMPLPWMGYKSDVMINGRLLLEDSTCQCMLGGKISIHFTRESANSVALWGGAKMPTEYIKEGFDWMAEQTKQSRKLRDQNMPGWMQSVAGVTDWMEDFSVGLVEGAVNGVVGLGEAVYQVAQDPVGTAEALGGMAKKGWDWASEGDNWSNAASGAWNWASEGSNWTNAATDGAKWVADNPRGLSNAIGQFIPDAVAAVYSGGGSLAATAGKTVVKEGLEAGGKAALREGVEGGLEKAAKELVGEAAEAGGKKTGREAVEAMMKHADDGEIPIVITKKIAQLFKITADPPFVPGKGHDLLEFERQILGQQAGMNKLTVDEFLANRDAYLKKLADEKAMGKKHPSGRSTEGTKAQRDYRKKYEADRIKELRKNEKLSYDDAKARAQEEMKGKAALHDPDQVAGGPGTNITGLGDSDINSSIGSQWEKQGRIDKIDAQIREAAKNMTEEERKNTLLNVHLYP